MSKWAFVIILLTLVNANAGLAESPNSSRDFPALNNARKFGWEIVSTLLVKLEESDGVQFPGIKTWVKEIKEATKGFDLKVDPGKWPEFDVDALVTKNPRFWDAYYEIAPGDPGATLLLSGLLLTGGKCHRAQVVAVIGYQGDGISKDVLNVFTRLIVIGQQVIQAGNQPVLEGIKLHDQGDFDGALKKYEEAIGQWPSNGFAWFEKGLSLREKDWAKNGKADANFSKEVIFAFAKSRQNDPWQVKAYQGADMQVIEGFRALISKGYPAWEEMLKKRPKPVADQVLLDFCNSLQTAQHDDLALASRQMMVSRHGGFQPGDHPFIATSLKRLAPHKITDGLLNRLAGKSLVLLPLIKTEPSPEKPK